ASAIFAWIYLLARLPVTAGLSVLTVSRRVLLHVGHRLQIHKGPQLIRTQNLAHDLRHLHGLGVASRISGRPLLWLSRPNSSMRFSSGAVASLTMAAIAFPKSTGSSIDSLSRRFYRLVLP